MRADDSRSKDVKPLYRCETGEQGYTQPKATENEGNANESNGIAGSSKIVVPDACESSMSECFSSKIPFVAKVLQAL